MNKKYCLILPLTILSLLSCNKNTNPKELSYDDTLSYVNKHSKELVKVKDGIITYFYDSSKEEQALIALNKLGISTPTSNPGKNIISNDNITNFNNKINNLNPNDKEEVVMALTPTNFKGEFFKDNNYKFKLENTNELVISYYINNDSYIRYYNKNLQLTRFEVDVNNNYAIYKATQTFTY